jgi:hypothetical protein
MDNDIVVVLDHPHGRVEVPLSEWMETGPGERPSLRPVAARERTTGRTVPIPLAARNSRLSRLLIRIGLLRDPWRR